MLVTRHGLIMAFVGLENLTQHVRWLIVMINRIAGTLIWILATILWSVLSAEGMQCARTIARDMNNPFMHPLMTPTIIRITTIIRMALFLTQPAVVHVHQSMMVTRHGLIMAFVGLENLTQHVRWLIVMINRICGTLIRILATILWSVSSAIGIQCARTTARDMNNPFMHPLMTPTII